MRVTSGATPPFGMKILIIPNGGGLPAQPTLFLAGGLPGRRPYRPALAVHSPLGVAFSSWAAETVPTTCSTPARLDRTSS
jgi:hypothetical protein